MLGASADRSKFGNKSLRAHLQKGFAVYPVNPKGGVIEGLEVFAAIADVPTRPLDRVTVYLPPAVALHALDDVAKVGCGQLWLNPGCDTPEVVEKARQLGLQPITACSIVDLGVSPADFD